MKLLRTKLYKVLYINKLPYKEAQFYKAHTNSLQDVADFMSLTVAANRPTVVAVLDRFRSVCGCGLNCVCSCWNENPSVYEHFGDAMRSVPSIKKLEEEIEELGETKYRVGHVEKLDTVLSNIGRFEVRVSDR